MTTESGPTICNKPPTRCAAIGDLPVGLLPGNHDAATADSALMRLELPADSPRYVET